ncbi:MAG: hypothetical protein IKH96_10225 [Ruminococcus sp.]|uniref:hypothetical protein n=1 Tax=Ruminococcus sp. TaxID=41978 RepID=UPI0025D0268F|nr:hypothetical protein [Ruminococcus sp.]MBR6996378.1 hypothetical protein [Ruminococcus sp.]
MIKSSDDEHKKSNHKYEEYDGYKLPEKQGFTNKAEEEKELRKHIERMKKIKNSNSIE